jgi:DNA-binding NarL/FixJ family response regulator
MLAPALDALSVGIVVCDVAGHVVFANASARERLRTGTRGPLRLRGGYLSAATVEETRTLKRLIREAASGNHWGAMGLSGQNGEETIPILLSPLLQSNSRRNEYILLAIGESGQSPWVTEATLGKLYRLSRTQGSIAIAIFNGQSPEDIASERGIKISTVRTHLADIFLRTRTRTQRDLIRLIGSLPPLAR